MTFISINDIADKSAKSSRRGPKPVSKDSVLFSSCKQNGKTKKGISISFRISALLMKKSRFIFGDRLDVLFDPSDRTGLIRRVKEGGYKLCVHGGSKNVADTTNKSGVVKMTHFHGMPSISTSAECENVSVDGEGILFRFPEATTFVNGIDKSEGK
jgi:hypothetical protein